MSEFHFKKRPTQTDVAKLAGVSRATVSFVLNNTPQRNIPITEETRKRVLDAVRELNYSPDPVAQMLASGNNNLVGVFSYEESFPLEHDDFYYEFLLGIERGASRSGYNVILFTRSTSEKEVRQVYVSNSNQIRLADGTIFLGAQPNREELAKLMEENYPFIFIGRRQVPGYEINWITSDSTPACKEITSYLIKLGHRKIAYIETDARVESNDDKLDGIKQALEENPDVTLKIYLEGVLEEQSVFVKSLAEHGCTAILCSHSTNFDKLVNLLSKEGKRIPEDFSIVSLANTTPNASYPFTPTYIHVNRSDWGELAFSSLVKILKKQNDKPIQTRLPCNIVLGNSIRPI